MTLYLLGLTLVVVSVVALLFANQNLRNTGRKRHKFFKAIKVFSLAYLLPVFGIIILLNSRGIYQQEYVTLENAKAGTIYIVAAVLGMFSTYVFIIRHVNNGIRLFRKGNRDVTKYTRALNNARNGMVILIVLIVTTLVINNY